MQAQTPGRPLILLSCPGDAPDLCRAILLSLSDKATDGTVVRQLSCGAETPWEPGDIGIALNVIHETQSALGGHLTLTNRRGSGGNRPRSSDGSYGRADDRRQLPQFRRVFVTDQSGVVAALRPPL